MQIYCLFPPKFHQKAAREYRREATAIEKKMQLTPDGQHRERLRIVRDQKRSAAEFHDHLATQNEVAG